MTDPIARLRDVVKHQPNFRGSRNDLLFLLDTIAELQDDSDVESVRHALQTSEARVDRLTAALREILLAYHVSDTTGMDARLRTAIILAAKLDQAALAPADPEPKP